MSGDGFRHILSVSGGKDSAALAIYMRDKISDMEYVFCDTEMELPETYEYLARLEAVVGKPIIRLKHNGRGFDHWYAVFGGYLPCARMRWCTKYLKLHPFEQYVGDSQVINYVGIRADEEREGYVSTKPNIKAAFPFKEDGLCYTDVVRILSESGIGLPTYLSWRSRSGCYLCFFQQNMEWVGLLEHHPDLYWKASRYEKVDERTGKRFTWNQHESLQELARPERIAAIKAEGQRRRQLQPVRDGLLTRILAANDSPDSDDGPQPCLICTL